MDIFEFAAAMMITLGAATAPSIAAEPARGKSAVETLVFVRHGEKPKPGLGLLTCQGLNRALKLPDFFAANFSRPDYIFAPDPSVKVTEVHGDGQRYDYVRPVLTIGPTAIRTGVPVNTQLPFNDPGLLADTLMDPRYHDATIYVVWEHRNIVTFAEILLNRLDNTSKVPEWPNSDYDTVFVFTIDWNEPRSMKFDVRSENLGQVDDTCPR
jgi:hypothetical protein